MLPELVEGGRTVSGNVVAEVVMAQVEEIEEILDFWFGSPQSDFYGTSRKVWFIKDPTFDQEVQTRFQKTYEQAAAGALESWTVSAQGSLALAILLDQFPRNLFRGTPQAFATDAQALVGAEGAIARHFDQALLPVQRWFLY
ncbi:MAG: DUF924 family protein, partial [Leptolyngbyaceae bacterium]|nr:DUF924 family protein [Leptolyngbyaceae bacterium]